MSKQVRYPAVAGSFYPQSPKELRKMITTLLDYGKISEPKEPPVALIVPHAGYIYSGPIAADAFKVVRDYKQNWKKVAVIGPAHFVYMNGFGLPSADFFRTPLGDVEICPELVSRLLEVGGVAINDEAHIQEHSIEVQIPFLQCVLEDFQLVPILVGDVSEGQMESLLQILFKEKDLLVILSSDLSHYFDYQTACQIDLLTTRAIEALKPERVSGEQACGAKAIRGLLRVVSKLGLVIQTITLANSGDTAGDKNRVVGYGAYAVYSGK